MSGMIECTVDVSDITPGQMKEVSVGDGKVLLVNDCGTFRALSNKCTHYGAPLVNGVFGDGHVRCPWHGACFDVCSGDIEDFPGLDSLYTYEVKAKGEGTVTVCASEQDLKAGKHVKPVAQLSCGANQTILIIGGGPSAAVCAETLRQEGFSGAVIVATKEKHVPYDRPKLSKAVSVTLDQIALRIKAYYDERKFEFKFEKEAVRVDTAGKTVTFKDGESLTYSKLVLATGTYARVLTQIPGHDLQNVTTLRSLDDAQFISEHSEGKNVVILGTSFIGVELAAALAGKAKSVTVVDLVEAPFQLALGKEVGGAVKKLLDEKGVAFRFKTTAKQFEGVDGKVAKVTLTDDTSLPVDLCVMGVGVLPVTDFLKDSGLDLSDRGFVNVNKYMQTSVPGVYAVGDITQFPLFMAEDASVNIQHWQMANQQGRVAALNLVGKVTEIKSVPFFWTVVCGKSLRYTGYGVGYDDIHVHGSMEELKFVVYYFKKCKVVAVASLQHDPIVSQAAEMFYQGQPLTKKDILEDPIGWVKRLKSGSRKV